MKHFHTKKLKRKLKNKKKIKEIRRVIEHKK